MTNFHSALTGGVFAFHLARDYGFDTVNNKTEVMK